MSAELDLKAVAKSLREDLISREEAGEILIERALSMKDYSDQRWN